VQNLDAGTILTTTAFAPAQTRIGTVRIPPEKTALAVRMENVSGVAGFAGAGDKVDIFGAKKEGRDGPEVRLVLQGVDVLNVNGTTLAPTPGQPEGPTLVFLLAVSPPEAERLVYLSTFEKLYFSLVPKDRSTVRPTSGTGSANALSAA
jgi:Flp pilus assembly protein CpaB